jgi:hypothetical protein
MSEVKYPKVLESDYVNYTSGQLVDALTKAGVPMSINHEEIKGALLVVLTKDLVESIDKHERAASRLSNVILWLNIILGIFTIVGTIISLYQMFGKK